MQSWWEADPELLEAEVDGLKSLGYWYEVEGPDAQTGLLLIAVEVPQEGEPLKLKAKYPADYPYFPPQVFLENRSFERHHHPTGKNLCLLRREGEDWCPGQDTLAILLRDQLPTILEINSGGPSPDYVASREDHVGEPFASFLNYTPGCAVIVPDETPNPEVESGKLSILARLRPADWPESVFVNGVLGTISDSKDTPLIEFKRKIPVFSKHHTGYWLRLSEAPARSEAGSAQRFTDLVCERIPAFKRALEKTRPGNFFVLGFVYPDEVSWRGNADDWFFVAVELVQVGNVKRVRSRFIKADWGGELAWMRRAPSLRPLREKSALLVGLGSLGSPLALHLARAGLEEMHLVDCDHLQVGNTIRWALGWQYAGFHKAAAIAGHIAGEYPYTRVHAHNLRLGDIYPVALYEGFREVASKVDLIIDASATYRVNHLLADLAQEFQKPYVWLTTTHGTAGGVVGRVLPGGATGCWHCFQWSLGDRSARLPADIGSDEIQPGGCSQATFIGTGINSDEVALLAGRLAVATLCQGAEGGYPDFAWNVAVGDFTRNGMSIAPDWTTYPLEVHSECLHCRVKQKSCG